MVGYLTPARRNSHKDCRTLAWPARATNTRSMQTLSQTTIPSGYEPGGLPPGRRNRHPDKELRMPAGETAKQNADSRP